MKKIEIRTKSRNYKVIIGNDIISKFSLELNEIEGKKLFIIDENVFLLHKSKLKDFLDKSNAVIKFIFHSTEKNKSLSAVKNIYDTLVENRFSRNDSIIAIGGGIVGDVSGFAAATYMRGIIFFQIPTTLLSMVDSSVGGKTGVNYSNLKNIIGSFYQPQKVYVDTSFLSTLPYPEIVSGSGEIFKYAFLSDEKNYKFIREELRKVLTQNYFDENLIACCIELKASVVESDEQEKTGLRKILNLGHTFAHAFESSLNFRIKHGEAVIAGIFASLIVSEKTGLISNNDLNKYITDFYYLPLSKKIISADYNEIIKFMKTDKKSVSGKINLVLVKKPGEIFIDFQVNERVIKFALKKLYEIIRTV
ncbi:3-dehydroquinate synthase [Ignavibacterium sp.]|uniref:3-dehydroquinate synthase n=1 Tax=Ignavibacterium sp. TaxID=2651167 RepID=UPI00307F2EAB